MIITRWFEGAMRGAVAALAVLVLALSLAGCAQGATTTADGDAGAAAESSEETVAAEVTDEVTDEAVDEATSVRVAAWELPEGTTLKRLVVLSRHNIRAPLLEPGSVVFDATPHTWWEWSAPASELSRKGALLELIMGQYFRQWMEGTDFVEHDWQPEEGEVRVYANSLQRTLATASAFVSGCMPTAGVGVEHHAELGEMDPVFKPAFTWSSEAYVQAVLDAVAAQGEGVDIAHMAAGAEDDFALIEDVLDLEDSPGFASGEIGRLVTDDGELNIEVGEEPSLKGSLKTATSLADALVLQYYEDPDPVSAGFGEERSFEEWQQIGSVLGTYQEKLFTEPIVSVNLAHPLLQELRSELANEDRALALFVGHDSNVASVLSALDASDYELEGAIERSTPIGCKVVLEVLEDEEGSELCRMRLVYATTEQLREQTMLDAENPPASCTLHLEDVDEVSEGVYELGDVLTRFDEAIDAYDQLRQTYGGEGELAEAA